MNRVTTGYMYKGTVVLDKKLLPNVAASAFTEVTVILTEDFIKEEAEMLEMTSSENDV